MKNRTVITLDVDTRAMAIIEDWAREYGFALKQRGAQNVSLQKTLPNGALYSLEAALEPPTLTLQAWVTHMWQEVALDAGSFLAKYGRIEFQGILNELLTRLGHVDATVDAKLPGWVRALNSLSNENGPKRVQCPNCGLFDTRPAGIGLRGFDSPGVIAKFKALKVDGECNKCRAIFDGNGRIKGVSADDQPVTPIQSAAIPPAKRSIEERLRHVDALRDQGLISEEEYVQKRAEILREL